MRIVVGITGASGAIYGIRLLHRLRAEPGLELHLVVSRAAEKTLHIEAGFTLQNLKNLADFNYQQEEIGARIASGSFQTDGMVVAPCSIQTLSAIAYGTASNLIIRAADVTLKERRRLILMVRETPFHLGHLRAMTAVTEMGAVVAPPVPAFYNHPKTIEDLVDQSVERVLDLLAIRNEGAKRWDGEPKER